MLIDADHKSIFGYVVIFFLLKVPLPLLVISVR